MNKGMVIGGGVLAVLVIAIFIGLGGGGGTTSDAPAFGEVSISGTPLPLFEDPNSDTAIGMPAPVVTGEGLDGSEIVIGQPDEPTIIMFLAHWCPHCQVEVPSVRQYLEENDVSGVTFISVATGTDPTASNYPPGDWLEREDWPVPALLDDETSSAGDAYGLSAFPYWVVLDGDGVVQFRLTGAVPDEQLQMIVDFAAGLGS